MDKFASHILTRDLKSNIFLPYFTVAMDLGMLVHLQLKPTFSLWSKRHSYVELHLDSHLIGAKESISPKHMIVIHTAAKPGFHKLLKTTVPLYKAPSQKVFLKTEILNNTKM